MEDHELQQAIIRETKTEFHLNSYEDDSQAVAALISQASSLVSIYSERLCPEIYDSAEVIEACHQFALKSPRSQIHILVDETRSLTQFSHRLLTLSHKHTSSIFFKKTDVDCKNRKDEFCCIDRSAYFKLSNSQHYQGTCNFSDSLVTGNLLSFFDDAWERSSPDPELRSYLL